MSALAFDEVSAFYGASQILHDVTLRVPQGAVACLLGLNGMGKTTALRATMGLVDRIEGTITLNGSLLTGRTHARCRMGVTLVPEDRKVFANLTVRENLQVATRKRGRSEDITLNDVLELFPRVGERLDQKAGTLSGGEQQMLVVARALLANPAYILLDEPSEGLAPSYVDAIRASIEAARVRGIGILLVEQSLDLALAVGDVFYVLENGHVVRSFTREEARAAPEQIAALLRVE